MFPHRDLPNAPPKGQLFWHREKSSFTWTCRPLSLHGSVEQPRHKATAAAGGREAGEKMRRSGRSHGRLLRLPAEQRQAGTQQSASRRCRSTRGVPAAGTAAAAGRLPGTCGQRPPGSPEPLLPGHEGSPRAERGYSRGKARRSRSAALATGGVGRGGSKGGKVALPLPALGWTSDTEPGVKLRPGLARAPAPGAMQSTLPCHSPHIVSAGVDTAGHQPKVVPAPLPLSVLREPRWQRF